MTRLSDIGEREAIAILTRIFDRGAPIGLGHDVGVVEWGEDYLVVTTDVVNPRTHVPEGSRPDQIGWYLVAVNLSDVAAAGARPLGFVGALSLPPSTDVDFLKGLARGMEACAEEFGIAVLGGDTKEADVISLAGTAIGRVRKDRILLRKGARPGDAIVVTGALGRAGLAVAQLADPEMKSEGIKQLLHPYPRLREGQIFSESGAVTSCMDISDGLALSLAQMAAMTGLSYAVEWEKVPRYEPLEALPVERQKEHALYAGGDFELVATVKSGSVPDLVGRLNEPQRGVRHGLAVIGKVGTPGPNLLVVGGKQEPLQDRGWEHFRVSHSG
ncbi:MAG TPA: thiamine-phosphate kinase [Thermoplasmata archaeon]|nr:thiamine-phosphate kinase [Thermoplasmata archaeon]